MTGAADRKVDELDFVGLNEVLLAEERAVLIDFWSPWCAPCRVMRPHLERLADSFADRCRIVAVNVEKHEKVAERYEVQTLPTLLLMQGGDTVHRFVGATTVSELAGHLDALPAGAQPSTSSVAPGGRAPSGPGTASTA